MRVFLELKRNQLRLTDAVLKDAPKKWRSQRHGIPMLSKESWIPSQPWPLDSLTIEWKSDYSRDDTSKLVERGRIIPGAGLTRKVTYSEALTDFAEMGHLFNGTIYRPVEIEFSENSRTMRFSQACYFEYLDTSEVLAYEAAGRSLRKRYLRRDRSLRSRLKDPFDLVNRVASLGVLTLTVRVSSEGSSFVLHKRDSVRVVLAPELFHVVPAGEFTPSDISIEAIESDFSIWRNIVREYAEEFLGVDDAQGVGGRTIDYEHEVPYRRLMDAKKSGDLRVYVLGAGLDPLTWKPELLTVAVFTASAFDRTFPDMVKINNEGTLIPGRPFKEAVIRNYLNNPATRPGGKACLGLAWHHREVLGLVPTAKDAGSRRRRRGGGR